MAQCLIEGDPQPMMAFTNVWGRDVERRARAIGCNEERSKAVVRVSGNDPKHSARSVTGRKDPRRP
ncbi:hypothetical protein WAI453_013201 [Rhynchosporium graminicola]